MTNGVETGVLMLDHPTSGWTTDFDDATATRFANLRPTPIVSNGAVPTGDTFPLSTSSLDSPVPNAPALYEIASGVATPAEFGDEIVRLFAQADPDSDPTATVHEMNTTDLVIVTQRGGADEVEATIHYYWLSRRFGVTQRFVDEAFQTHTCASRAEGTVCI